MIRLGNCKVVRCFARKRGEGAGVWLSEDQIAALADCVGELRENGTRWCMEYGESEEWESVVATVEADEQIPAIEQNVAPKDCSGNRLTPGDYECRRGGDSRLATVFEDESSGELLVRFEGSDRTQRVSELSQYCSWFPIVSKS